MKSAADEHMPNTSSTLPRGPSPASQGAENTDKTSETAVGKANSMKEAAEKATEHASQTGLKRKAARRVRVTAPLPSAIPCAIYLANPDFKFKRSLLHVGMCMAFCVLGGSCLFEIFQ
jgi:hypothetical protein